MIPEKLIDYVRIYEGFYDKKLCEKAVDSLKKSEWQLHQYYNNIDKNYISYDHELSISYQRIAEYQEINKKIWFAIEQYILKDFKEFVWFTGWSGYTNVRFNKYDVSTQMRLHCDHIQSIFDGERQGIPILTVLGVLNDDYEGGEFLLFGDKIIDIPVGSVMVFPSNFLYPHEVKPVTSGTRYSFVSWVW